MIGKLLDMALLSWEMALTPNPKKFEYPAGLMAALAGLTELQRQIDAIKANGGVRLEMRLQDRPNDKPTP
jgi:hypothetical protein